MRYFEFKREILIKKHIILYIINLNLYLCHSYIKLYGLKFSKEDHILFIKLLFELVTVPEIPSVSTLKCLNTLILLLV